VSPELGLRAVMTPIVSAFLCASYGAGYAPAVNRMPRQPMLRA
jgi:hypothetical protein